MVNKITLNLLTTVSAKRMKRNTPESKLLIPALALTILTKRFSLRKIVMNMMRKKTSRERWMRSSTA